MVIDTLLVSSSSDSGLALAADLFGHSTGVGTIGHYGPTAVVVSSPPSAPRSEIGQMARADRNYTLFIGAYDDEASAQAVFATIKDLDDAAVEAAAGIGAGIAKIAKHHDEKKLGVDAQEWLPADSSAILAVVDDLYLDRIDAAFEKATKKIGKAIDKGDYDPPARDVGGFSLPSRSSLVGPGLVLGRMSVVARSSDSDVNATFRMRDPRVPHRIER